MEKITNRVAYTREYYCGDCGRLYDENGVVRRIKKLRREPKETTAIVCTKCAEAYKRVVNP
jgi:DNA-directed RNA polymerase subunit RPC12/RpoP